MQSAFDVNFFFVVVIIVSESRTFLVVYLAVFSPHLYMVNLYIKKKEKQMPVHKVDFFLCLHMHMYPLDLNPQ